MLWVDVTMVFLKELSKQLNLPENCDFIGIENEIDIGEFTFTNYKKIGKYLVKFTNWDNPNIILLNNRGVLAIILYELNDSDNVDATLWLNRRKTRKRIPIDRINKKYLNNMCRI